MPAASAKHQLYRLLVFAALLADCRLISSHAMAALKSWEASGKIGGPFLMLQRHNYQLG